MYTAQITINRIQSLIKEKGLTQKSVLADCGINENTLKRMTDNKGISSFYLAKIADSLNCSVDYLLGRTDTPNGTYTINNQNTTVSGTQASIINHNVTASENTPDTLTEQFIQTFKELDFKDKVDVMQFAVNKTKNNC